MQNITLSQTTFHSLLRQETEQVNSSSEPQPEIFSRDRSVVILWLEDGFGFDFQ